MARMCSSEKKKEKKKTLSESDLEGQLMICVFEPRALVRC